MVADGGERETTLEERLSDLTLILAACRRAVRAALQQHKRAGNPVAIWRDGEVVWLAPDDIPDTDECETGEPVTVRGAPLSDTVLRDRR